MSDATGDATGDAVPLAPSPVGRGASRPGRSRAGRAVARVRRRAALAVLAVLATVVPVSTVLAPPAQADVPSTITGTVTFAGTGAPIGGIEVNAYGGIYAALYGSATTAADGTYTLTLPVGINGSFWVRFRDTGGLHTTVWYGGSPTMVGSTQLSVPPAGSATASIAMTAPTTIGGTVRTAAGNAVLGGITATVVDASTLATVATGTSAANGTWSTAVAAGSYKVRYDDPLGIHPTTWSGGAASGATAATVVVANATHATTDVTLAPPATVAGHVTDTSAAPIPALQVFLLEPVWGSVRATATTDATGAYALPAVPATWRIRFHDPQGAFPDWYTGGSPTWAASSTITLGAGTTTLDLQLAHNPEVSGTVTGSGSGPLAGIVVLAVAADRSVVASTTTAADGTYTFVVPVGPTRLRFFDPSGTWALQYAGPAGPFDEATVLDAVAEGHHTVDMAMVAGAGLSGQVTVGTFGPGAPTVAVLAFDDQYFDLVGGASVAADGTWTMRGLPPGPTKLLLIDHRLEGGLETAYRPVFSGDRDVIAEGLGPSFTAAAAFTASSGTTTPTGTMGVVGYHCDPTVAVPGADLRTTFGAGLGVPVNLDGCDLHGADLRGTTLTGSLRYADLSHADLSDAVLGTSAMVPYVDVVYTKGDLTGAKITGANLHHAWAFNTQLLAANPDWTGTDLRADTHKPSGVVGGIDSWPVFWGGTGPTLVGGYAAHPLTPASSVPYSGSPLVLDGAVMEHVLFGSMPGITITGLTCSSCLFGTYDITQAKAINVDLHGASFPNLTCDQCTFVHADLRNADLTGAVCTGCDLEAADPRGAQMGGADLTGANIRNVFFRQTLGLTGPQLLATNGDWYGVDIGGLGLDFSGGTFPAGAQMSATLWGNDFAGANLFGRSLQYADLHGVDLHGANLSFADLSYANLAGANLHGANVTGAVFTGANLTGADTGGWVTSTNLSGLDLRGTDFSNKDLTGFSFVGSDLRGAKFDFAKLVNADLHGANAAGATFNSATWTGADVTGTDLTGALLSGGAFGSVTGFTSGQLLSASKYWAGIDLTGTGFSFSGFDFKTPGYVIEGSKLSGLDLSGATIPAHADGVTWAGANLSGLHASGTSFAYANLAGANLAGADLSNTFTLNTDLTGATLTGATVTGASLRGAAGTTFAQLATTNRNWAGVETPVTSFAGADLRASSGWNLAGASFYGINVSSANLTGTNLTGATFLQANLTWANLTNANLTNADLRSADVRSSVLGGANLTGAKITGAQLSNAWSLTKAQLLSTNHDWTNTKLDAIGLDLTGTDFTSGGFSLTGVSFRKVKLNGANLSGRNLTGVSLTQANLSSATFAGASGGPTGGSTAVYSATTCPDSVVTNGGAVTTCVGHGFGA